MKKERINLEQENEKMNILLEEETKEEDYLEKNMHINRAKSI